MKQYFIIFFLLIILTSCRGCSNKRIRNNSNYNDVSDDNKETTFSLKNNTKRKKHNSRLSNSVIKMREDNGVYYVPIEINGLNMEFIFDTGASIISLSQTEAMFLWKQGKLSEDDFIEVVDFIDANGDISEGTVVNLKTVKIGDKVIYNVKASIVHNQIAPLLFGQSAMNHFGKITIDYNNNEITFND